MSYFRLLVQPLRTELYGLILTCLIPSFDKKTWQEYWRPLYKWFKNGTLLSISVSTDIPSLIRGFSTIGYIIHYYNILLPQLRSPRWWIHVEHEQDQGVAQDDLEPMGPRLKCFKMCKSWWHLFNWTAVNSQYLEIICRSNMVGLSLCDPYIVYFKCQLQYFIALKYLYKTITPRFDIWL